MMAGTAAPDAMIQATPAGTGMIDPPTEGAMMEAPGWFSASLAAASKARYLLGVFVLLGVLTMMLILGGMGRRRSDLPALSTLGVAALEKWHSAQGIRDGSQAVMR